MSICDFCLEYEAGEKCRLGFKVPKRMSCRAFDPTMDKFCSNPADFVDPRQVVQMASYFGMKGGELKKVQAMAALVQLSRS